MTLLTDEQREDMLQNGREQRAAQVKGGAIDFKPVVKLFTPDADAAWLLTELDPDNHDIAFGLCDWGDGFPLLGSIRISTILQIRGRANLPIQRDLYFKADKSLSSYIEDARIAGHIKY